MEDRNNMEVKKNNKIDISQIIKTVISKKVLFLKVWAITLVLSCIWILPQPRFYTATVSIAPESSDMSKNMGGLASMASNFGLNLGNGSSDAIYPQLYPDLLKSTEFLVGLLDIQIETKDGKIKTDYYTYLNEKQKQNILLLPWNTFKGWISSLTREKDLPVKGKNGKRFDPFQLTQEVTDVIGSVKENINCTYSRTTDVVTITVKDQDPLTCALLADSIKEHLQTFITEYRTKKSRVDYDYYKRLTAEAKSNYDKARMSYATYSDANEDVILQSVRSKITDLENEMQLKYDVYSAMNTRLEAAQAKVQESTPVFTTLNNATVPVKPAGPKRMIFVATMLFLSTLGTIAHLYRRELREWF